MTKLTHSEQNNQQIQHLKRLLVSMKHHYEKSLHQAQIQLQVEQNQQVASQKELTKVQFQISENQKLYEDEIQSLRSQQNILKDLLKKSQDEVARLQGLSEINLGEPKNNEHKAQEESKQLEIEISEANQKILRLEQELLTTKQNAQSDQRLLSQLLEEQKQKHFNGDMDTVVSTTSSHHLRLELEGIKSTLLQSAQESKALESRYIEILDEKIKLQRECKDLHHLIECQSSELKSLKEKELSFEEQKSGYQALILAKEAECLEFLRNYNEREAEIARLNEWIKEKQNIEQKYEQLIEELSELNVRFEEIAEDRTQMSVQLSQLEELSRSQQSQLQETNQQLQILHHEKSLLESDRDQLKNLLDESEMRLKVAQQHLAKKVKESALVNEKMEEHEAALGELYQTIDHQKTALAQLQASVDLYQRQENRLQEQLHDALKGNEAQMSKWEEKYFRLYDKWQESENKIRDLKKLEEKHAQLQSLLSNLGNFVGNSNFPPQTGVEILERSIVRQDSYSASFQEEMKPSMHEERFDLFGMPHSIDKHSL